MTIDWLPSEAYLDIAASVLTVVFGVRAVIKSISRGEKPFRVLVVATLPVVGVASGIVSLVVYNLEPKHFGEVTERVDISFWVFYVFFGTLVYQIIAIAYLLYRRSTLRGSLVLLMLTCLVATANRAATLYNPLDPGLSNGWSWLITLAAVVAVVSCWIDARLSRRASSAQKA